MTHETILKCDSCGERIYDCDFVFNYDSDYFDANIDVCENCIIKRIEHSLNIAEVLE